MSDSGNGGPPPTIRMLVRRGITHVVGIPDNTSGPLFPEVEAHPSIRLVRVAREGEAFAVAAGLWLGGASPLVVVQNTGLLESGDALRGTAGRMAAPIPIVVTGRGYTKMDAAGFGSDTPRTLETLTRPDVDSVALLTEPTLDAWGVPYEVCRSCDDPAAAIGRVIDAAIADSRPTALVLTGSILG